MRPPRGPAEPPEEPEELLRGRAGARSPAGEAAPGEGVEGAGVGAGMGTEVVVNRRRSSPSITWSMAEHRGQRSFVTCCPSESVPVSAPQPGE